MSRGAPETHETKMLPAGAAPVAVPVVASQPAPAEVTRTVTPARQLHELPKDELEHLAEEYGLRPREYKTRQHLVGAIHERRQTIAAMDREAMLDCVRWGRRPVTQTASKEQLAQEIVRIKTMRFGGLSQQGLVVLARLRGVKVESDDRIPILVKKLKKQEGFFARVNRRRRSFLGRVVSNMLGEGDAAGGAADYQYLPPSADTAGPSAAGKSPSIKEEIEEAGLFGGITSRIKRSADEYLNQKLDEIEARIDRKLDEIDRRLAEWRDKEIANRIRILKITLWASVIVGAFSLVYSYVKEAISPSDRPVPAHVIQNSPAKPNK